MSLKPFNKIWIIIIVIFIGSLAFYIALLSNHPANKPPNRDKTITITSPNGGEQWKIGSTQLVTWMPAKTTPENKVWIAIKGENPNKCHTSNGGVICEQPIVYTIAKQIENSGNFSWTIDLGIKPGKYKLIVSLPLNTTTILEEDVSNDYFEIIP